MNHIKIVAKGWAGYTGQLNIISFRDGVSTEPVPQSILDRIAAVTQIVACEADGTELNDGAHVGIQNRLVGGVTLRAAVKGELARQTDEEKNLEALVDADKAGKAPVDKLYTSIELEQVAEKEGIKGLRTIAGSWKVHGKSFPALINGILAAQAKFLSERTAATERLSGKVRTLQTAEEEEVVAEAAAAAEADLEAFGCEDLKAEYYLDDKVIPASTLIAAALKNCGKSLTGWNKLEDRERHDFILAEIEAIETHFGMQLSDTPAEEVLANEPESSAPVGTDGDDAPVSEEADAGADDETTDGDSADLGSDAAEPDGQAGPVDADATEVKEAE